MVTLVCRDCGSCEFDLAIEVGGSLEVVKAEEYESVVCDAAPDSILFACSGCGRQVCFAWPGSEGQLEANKQVALVGADGS